MKLRDAMIFGPLALGLHVVAFAALPPLSNGGAGDDGDASFTLQSVPVDLATLVEAWDRPPDVATTPDTITIPPEAAEAPLRPQTDTPVARSATPAGLALGLDAPPPTLPSPTPLPLAIVPQMPALSPPSAPDVTPKLRTPIDPVALPETAPMRPDLAQPSDAPTVETSAPEPQPHQILTEGLRPKPRPEQQVTKTAPSPKPPSAAPKVSERAKGSAKASNKSAGTSQAPTQSVERAGVLKQATAAWGGKIRHAIERKKFYPNGTRASGTVVIALVVAQNGALRSAQVYKSSNDGRLDQAALSAVKRARFPAAPKELTQSSYTFQIPIRLGQK